MKRNVWDICKEMVNLEDEMDKLSWKKGVTSNKLEKDRIDKEIDRLMVRHLELKHILERILI